MFKCRVPLILVMGLLFSITSQAFDSSIRFDYTVYLHINSTPSGVTLYSVAKNEGDEPQEIGITPLTLAIGLDWDRRFWQRAWKTLRVTSAQNCCEAIYNTDNTYDIFFACDATKSGYYAKEYAQSIMTLNHPGYTWGGMKEWTEDTYINLTLDKMPILSKTPPQKIPTMIFASGKDTGAVDMSEVQVRSIPEDARIFIDGKHVGTTPLNIHIADGTYTIKMKQRGYEDYITDFEIKSPTKKTIQAIMEYQH